MHPKNKPSDKNVLAKQKLLKERENLLNIESRLDETGMKNSLSDSLSELSMYDNHPADIGDELFERSKDLALRDNEHILLEQVEDALDKIEEGSYGICDRCGKPIDSERLEALPSATLCIHCQREFDVLDTTPRPLEEELLAPPFYNSFLDSTEIDNVGFDGEDALQAVLKYGSSDTPQDVPRTRRNPAWPNKEEYIGIVEFTDAIPVGDNTTENVSEKTDNN